MQNFLVLSNISEIPLVQKAFDIQRKQLVVLKDANSREEEFYGKKLVHGNVLRRLDKCNNFSVFAFYETSLYGFVTTFGTCSQSFQKNVSLSLSRALRFIHSFGIVHCDVKPENVLLSFKGSIVLSDFGSSQSMPVKDPETTLAYCAPEILKGEELCEGIDWWALGCTLEFCENGYHVFLAATEEETLEKIQKRHKVAKLFSDNPKIRGEE
ncbi:putative serine/threonine protein kinase [Lausannevirus]|uniref:non-specific serine/threonine protein kinase n=1 Tax=Lausannevirus TaxID=999883 RepID=F2WLV3_9VIRU|nr:serine-threonine kinase [Lausannevirus]AEA07226.1 putative serine/threonine protein kinase [Lausannevirus]